MDVGSGSGYLTVCMALMMEGGFAYGIENPMNLAKVAMENIKKNHIGLLEEGKAVMLLEKGVQTIEDVGPFDAIYLGTNENQIPKHFLDSLSNGGRMVPYLSSSKYLGNASWKFT